MRRDVSHLKRGDRVVVRQPSWAGAYRGLPGFVIRLTPTRVIVAAGGYELPFMKSTGRMVGTSDSVRPTAVLPIDSPEVPGLLAANLRLEALREAGSLLDIVRSTKDPALPWEQFQESIRAVADAIEQARKEGQ